MFGFGFNNSILRDVNDLIAKSGMSDVAKRDAEYFVKQIDKEVGRSGAIPDLQAQCEKLRLLIKKNDSKAVVYSAEQILERQRAYARKAA